MFIRRIPFLIVMALPWTAPLHHAVAAEPDGEFAAEIRRFEELDRLQPSRTNAIVFAGSSSFRLWTNLPAAFPGLTVLNRGFGGSTMRDLLQHFDRVVAVHHPRAVLVYEGDNDLAKQRPPAEVAAEYAQFLDRMQAQLPGTPVILLAVKPSPSRRALLDQQRDLNQRIRALCDSRPGVAFADTFTAVLNGAGEPDPAFFERDQLHLNAHGYRAWTPVIVNALAPLLAAPAPDRP
ncbi:MAG: hypothetical protein KIT22_12185 [Verrucomicrobiae bacterium]|nr:hypothetical protein [Verrucomicrobiae bacterium]